MPSPIRYACQRCTNCCRWPGFVRITEEEVSSHHSPLPLRPFQAKMLFL